MSLFVLMMLVVIDASKAAFLNLDFFLGHSKNCYVNFIVYNETLDFAYTVQLAAITSVDFVREESPAFTKSCAPNPYLTANISTVHDGLCDRVLANYFIKNIRCVHVLLAMTQIPSDIRDAYAYLRSRWSNADYLDKSISFSYKSHGKLVDGRKDVIGFHFYTPGVFLSAILPPSDSGRDLFQQFQVKEVHYYPYRVVPFLVYRTQHTSSFGISHHSELVVQSVSLEGNYVKPGYYLKVNSAKITGFMLYGGVQSSFRASTHLRVKVTVSNDSPELECGTVLASFFTELFNSTQGVQDGFRLYIRHNALKKVYVGDSEQIFVPLRVSSYSAITCEGLEIKLGVYKYAEPYHRTVWLVAIVIFGTVTTFLDCTLISYKIDSFILMVLAHLLEQPLRISDRLKRFPWFRICFGAFLFMSVVLSNAYKGFVTTNIIKPFDVIGINSFTQTLEDGFIYYFQPSRRTARWLSNCCRDFNSTDMCRQTAILYALFWDSYAFPFIAMGLLDPLRQVKFLSAFGPSQNIENISAELVFGSQTSNKDTMVLKVVKHLRTATCSEYKAPIEYTTSRVLECDNSLYILEEKEAKELLLKGKLAQNSLYMLPDQSLKDIIPDTLVGFNIYFVAFLKPLFEFRAKAFVESGIYNNMWVAFKNNRTRNITNEFSNSVQLTTRGVQSLSLKTTSGVVFLVYLLLVPLTIVCFFSEISHHSGTVMRARERLKKNRKKWRLILAPARISVAVRKIRRSLDPDDGQRALGLKAE